MAQQAGAEPALDERIDAFVRSEMSRQRVPGVAVAIIKRGAVLKAQGYGFANLEHRVPVTAETIFESGSLGKQFTAAAVMLQVEDGKLSLSDPVGRHVAALGGVWGKRVDYGFSCARISPPLLAALCTFTYRLPAW